MKHTLKEFMSAEGIKTKKALAGAIGVSPQQLTNYMNTENPSPTFINLINEHFPHWATGYDFVKSEFTFTPVAELNIEEGTGGFDTVTLSRSKLLAASADWPELSAIISVRKDNDFDVAIIEGMLHLSVSNSSEVIALLPFYEEKEALRLIKINL